MGIGGTKEECFLGLCDEFLFPNLWKNGNGDLKLEHTVYND